MHNVCIDLRNLPPAPLPRPSQKHKHKQKSGTHTTHALTFLLPSPPANQPSLPTAQSSAPWTFPSPSTSAPSLNKRKKINGAPSTPLKLWEKKTKMNREVLWMKWWGMSGQACGLIMRVMLPVGLLWGRSGGSGGDRLGGENRGVEGLYGEQGGLNG